LLLGAADQAIRLVDRSADCASLAGKSHLIVFALSKARTTFPSGSPSTRENGRVSLC
jgi:hypothetical protein